MHAFEWLTALAFGASVEKNIMAIYLGRRRVLRRTDENGRVRTELAHKRKKPIDKYAKHNINGDMLNKWKGQNRNKTLIHKLKRLGCGHVGVERG